MLVAYPPNTMAVAGGVAALVYNLSVVVDKVGFLLKHGDEIYRDGTDGHREQVLSHVKKMEKPSDQLTVLLSIHEIPDDKRFGVICTWETELQQAYYAKHPPDLEGYAKVTHSRMVANFLLIGMAIPNCHAAALLWMKTGYKSALPDLKEELAQEVANVLAGVGFLVYFYYYGTKNALRSHWMTDVMRAVEATMDSWLC